MLTWLYCISSIRKEEQRSSRRCSGDLVRSRKSGAYRCVCDLLLAHCLRREQGPAQRPVIRVKGRLQRLGPEDFLCGFRKRTILREAAVGFALHVCELMWKLWDSQRPPAKCCIPLTTCSGHAVMTPAYSTVLTPTKNVSLKRNKKYKNSPWMFGLVYLVLLGCVLQGSLCSLVEGASRSGCGGGCWSHVAAKHRVTA